MNESLFYFFNSFAGQSLALDRLIIFVADYLGWVVLGWALIYFLFFRRSEMWLLFIPTVAWLVSEILQRLTAWPRPFAYLPDVQQLVEHVPTGSFPSSHTTFFFALALVVYTLSRKLGHWYLAAALLICLARVVAGVHWPSDILGGIALGALVSAIFFLIHNLLTSRQVRL